MEDGSAIRPPMGKRDVQERGQASEPERGAGLAEAEGNGLEPGPEVLGVEGAAPDRHGEPGDRERLEHDPDLRKREEEEEDLDEDRGVADDLDVDRRELADHRDTVRARGSEDEPDDEGAGDRDRGDLERSAESREELVAVLRDERPVECDGEDVTSVIQERPREARPLRRSC